MTNPDVADDVVLAESVSIAMLTVLETLGPAERAVFMPRDVLVAPHDEIAPRSRWEDARPKQCGRSPIGRGPTWRRAAREHRSAGPSSKELWIGSSPRSPPVGCRRLQKSLLRL